MHCLLTHILLAFLFGSFSIASANSQDKNSEITALIATLEHPDSHWKKLEEARNRLVEIGDAAVPYLIESVKKQDGGRALYTLKRMTDQPITSLMPKWREFSDSDKWKFMPYLGELELSHVVDYAISSLSSKDDRIKKLAIEHFMRFPTKKAVEPLIRLVRTENSCHWFTAVWSIAKNKDSRVEDELILLLEPTSRAAKPIDCYFPPPPGPQDKTVVNRRADWRSIVITVIGELKLVRASSNLLAILNESKPASDPYSGQIILLLAEFDYRAAVPTIQTIYNNTVPDSKNITPTDLKAQYAAALLKLGDKTGRDYLAKELKSKEWSRRRFAAKAFMAHGDKGDLPLFISLLDDSDWGVLEAATCGLSRVTEEKKDAPGSIGCGESSAPLWKKWSQSKANTRKIKD